MVGLMMMREIASQPYPRHLVQAEIEADIALAREPDHNAECARLRHAINTLCTVLGRSPFAVTADEVPEETVVECVRLWVERDGLSASMVLTLLRQFSALGVNTKGLWLVVTGSTIGGRWVRPGGSARVPASG